MAPMRAAVGPAVDRRGQGPAREGTTGLEYPGSAPAPAAPGDRSGLPSGCRDSAPLGGSRRARAGPENERLGGVCWPTSRHPDGFRGLLRACDKHDCKLDGKQVDYWKEIAPVTEGAEKCLAGSNPFGCDLEGDRCVPTLDVIHAGKTQKQLEDHYKAALTQQEWTLVGEKVREDGSKSLAFDKGDRDELLIEFGSSNLSTVMAGESGVDVFITRMPEEATGTMLDEYKGK